MAATASERLSKLAPVINDARQQVADLSARVVELTAWAKGHYANGDAEQGDSAHADIARVRAELTAAEERLTTLVEAEQVVSREGQREEDQERLAGVQARLEAALDERDRQMAAIFPTLAAVKVAIKQARANDELVKILDGERAGLESAIAGRPMQPHRSMLGRVAGVIDASRLLLDVEHTSVV